MSVVQKIDRRQAERYEAAFGVRFAINNGPEFRSNTLNFISRSIAIRSDVLVRKGDQVDVRFAALPDIRGEVARVFPEGFAVALNKASLDMMARIDGDASKQQGALEPNVDVSSPLIPVKSRYNARALFASAFGGDAGYNRHLLSLITAEAAALENIRNIWIGADGIRWFATDMRFKRCKNRSIAVLPLNDWQMHMGAAYGLTLSLVSHDMKEWTADIPAGPIAAHLECLLTPAKRIAYS